MKKIAYLLEKRIPLSLQKLVESKLIKAGLAYEKIFYDDDKKKISEVFERSTAVLCAPGRYIDPLLYQNSSSLKLFQLWSSGYDKFDINFPASKGIFVCNNGGSNAICVAEHTVLLILAKYKNIIEAHRRTITGNWAGNSHGMDMYMLKNKVVGIIGLGNIGNQLAKRLDSFGCNFLVYDKEKKDKNDFSFDFKQTDLEELAKKSDIISLHLHHNQGTDKIIDRSFFSLMKKTAIIINVSRAGLVDQDELYSALSEKRIGGAGLDVYEREPTIAGDKLLELPTVVATPHMAGSTVDVYHDALDKCLSNIKKVLNNEAPDFIVNGV